MMKDMNKLFAVALLFAALIVGGCSSAHVVVMKDGRTIESKDQPKYDPKTGFYEYHDMDGNKVRVNKEEVVEFKKK